MRPAGERARVVDDGDTPSGPLWVIERIGDRRRVALGRSATYRGDMELRLVSRRHVDLCRLRAFL